MFIASASLCLQYSARSPTLSCNIVVAMESLTLDDGHSYQRYQDHLRSKDRRHRSPRLPTPETSRSGNDSQSPPDSSHPARDLLARSGGGVAHMRHDSHNSAGQPSPPYRSTDMMKPSLPPLKTVGLHLPTHIVLLLTVHRSLVITLQARRGLPVPMDTHHNHRQESRPIQH